MKQDTKLTPDDDIVVAVVPRQSEDDADLWDIYLINDGDRRMENIVITSQGYGILDGQNKTTTVLRHFHQKLDPGQSIKVEPIQQELFGIKNEYQVSFNVGEETRDKTYVFTPGQIGRDQLETVPVMRVSGVFKR